jgi:hypothetical protein
LRDLGVDGSIQIKLILRVKEWTKLYKLRIGFSVKFCKHSNEPFEFHKNRNSLLGWEIDGGTTVLSNILGYVIGTRGAEPLDSSCRRITVKFTKLKWLRTEPRVLVDLVSP